MIIETILDHNSIERTLQIYENANFEAEGGDSND